MWIRCHGKALRVEFFVVDAKNVSRIKEIEQDQIDRLSPMLNLINARG